MTGADDTDKEHELIGRYPNHHNERTAPRKCEGALISAVV